MSLPNDSWRALLWHKLKSRKICIVTGILICHGLFLQWLDFVFYSEVHMSTLASWCRLGKQKDNSRAVKALGKEVEWGESVRDVCGTCGHTAAPKKQTLMVALLYWVSCWAAGTKNRVLEGSGRLFSFVLHECVTGDIEAHDYPTVILVRRQSWGMQNLLVSPV